MAYRITKRPLIQGLNPSIYTTPQKRVLSSIDVITEYSVVQKRPVVSSLHNAFFLSQAHLSTLNYDSKLAYSSPKKVSKAPARDTTTVLEAYTGEH